MLITFNARAAASSAEPPWWDRVTVLNASQNSRPLGFQWNRVCKLCGIKVCYQKFRVLYHCFAQIPEQALTGERIHDQCFVCGPKGVHYQAPLPPYPQEWDYFIDL
ncbi:hypothetical protein B0H13DRAFT_1592296 [Mycena leptocephala]|nr:hypothetical protein B0H13DRAFT_1592296 [Mycena leptocephala]